MPLCGNAYKVSVTGLPFCVIWHDKHAGDWLTAFTTKGENAEMVREVYDALFFSPYPSFPLEGKCLEEAKGCTGQSTDRMPHHYPDRQSAACVIFASYPWTHLRCEGSKGSKDSEGCIERFLRWTGLAAGGFLGLTGLWPEGGGGALRAQIIKEGAPLTPLAATPPKARPLFISYFPKIC